jgi:hypothetical protein
MKGKQVALTLYLEPKKYWLLKALSAKSGVSMQHLLRTALENVLSAEYRRSLPSGHAQHAASILRGQNVK